MILLDRYHIPEYVRKNTGQNPNVISGYFWGTIPM